MSYDTFIAAQEQAVPRSKRRRCVACEVRAATPGSDTCARCFIDL